MRIVRIGASGVLLSLPTAKRKIRTRIFANKAYPGSKDKTVRSWDSKTNKG